MNFVAIRWRRIPTVQVAVNGVCQMQDGEDWIYSAEGFNGQGIVAGMELHCLSPAIQVPVQAYALPLGDNRFGSFASSPFTATAKEEIEIGLGLKFPQERNISHDAGDE